MLGVGAHHACLYGDVRPHRGQERRFALRASNERRHAIGDLSVEDDRPRPREIALQRAAVLVSLRDQRPLETGMTAPVAATAYLSLLTCPRVTARTLHALRVFRDRRRGFGNAF